MISINARETHVQILFGHVRLAIWYAVGTHMLTHTFSNKVSWGTLTSWGTFGGGQTFHVQFLFVEIVMLVFAIHPSRTCLKPAPFRIHSVFSFDFFQSISLHCSKLRLQKKPFYSLWSVIPTSQLQFWKTNMKSLLSPSILVWMGTRLLLVIFYLFACTCPPGCFAAPLLGQRRSIVGVCPPVDVAGEDIVSFPDSEDCTIFYECYLGRAYQKQCPAGLYWDALLQTCDYPQRAVCLAKITWDWWLVIDYVGWMVGTVPVMTWPNSGVWIV